MRSRALVPALVLATLTACSDDGGTSIGNMSTGTADGSSTTTGTTETSATSPTAPTSAPTTTAPDTTGAATTGSATSDPGTTTTGTTLPATSTDATGTTTGVPGCAGGGLGPGDHTIMLDHGGMTRTAIVHVPPGYDAQTPSPVVLNFHGFTSNAQNQADFSQMNATADANDFVVVYPEGLYNSWNAGLCCGQAVSSGVDDVGFVRALVAELHAELCVDPKRIYSAGMSNGGYISHRLACEAADLIAAAGPVSATVVIDPCVPSRPIPVMMFNGTADFLVPYGGGIYQSAPQSFSDWAAYDGCTDSPELSQQAGAVTCETYDECDDGVAVTLCTVEGMGHCWPGAAVCPWGTPNTDLSANDALWAFFSQFTLP